MKFTQSLLLSLSLCAVYTSQAFAAPQACAVVGIKSSDQYFSANERSCFANVKKASKKGFVASSTASAIRGFSVSLDGSSEVPPVTTSATGQCLAALLPDGVTLRIGCTHNVVSPNGAHLHQGPIGSDGNVICNFGDATSPLSHDCTLTTDQVSSLLSGGTYINIHSSIESGGEIRGQLQ